ncbi:hypothetical protein CSUI_010701 [Cystoisospora suis]|uniref:Uncharacterized protein n=1 Tax=Cystoisospora suis TaxID=483139 RepID=A0A2C6KEC4_9APIC|nr:hypothetical protein CSUI_010701 [Cystoisospora suis]
MFVCMSSRTIFLSCSSSFLLSVDFFRLFLLSVQRSSSSSFSSVPSCFLAKKQNLS